MALDCVVVGMNFGVAEHGAIQSAMDGKSNVSMYGTKEQTWDVFARELLNIDGTWMNPLGALSYIRNNALQSTEYYSSFQTPSPAGMYLLSYLRKRNYQAELVNCFNFEAGKLKRFLEQENPRCVAVTGTFYLESSPIIEIVRYVREINADTKVIVGGPFFFNMCRYLQSVDGYDKLEDAMDFIDADLYIRSSQGEATLGKVIESLRNGTPIKKIDNLYVRNSKPSSFGEDPQTQSQSAATMSASSGEESRWLFTGEVVENNSMDEEAIDWKLVQDHCPEPIVSTRTARSCAFKCKFCDYPTFAGKLTLTDLDVVMAELKAITQLGIRHVVFVDDTFNVPIRRFKELCQRMIDEKLGIHWYSYFRASNAKEEVIYDLMVDSGCRGVFLGIESAAPPVLEAMNKLAKPERYAFGIEQLKKRNIITYAAILVGFPGETKETVNTTIRFLNDTAPDYYTVHPWWYDLTAPIAKEAEDWGLTGQWYDWEHDSMNSREAFEACKRFFVEVNNSVWVPTNHHDFWTIPYMLSKGMTAEEIKRFHILVKQLLDDNFASKASSPNIEYREDSFKQFSQLCVDANLSRGLVPDNFEFLAGYPISNNTDTKKDASHDFARDLGYFDGAAEQPGMGLRVLT